MEGGIENMTEFLTQIRIAQELGRMDSEGQALQVRICEEQKHGIQKDLTYLLCNYFDEANVENY